MEESSGLQNCVPVEEAESLIGLSHKMEPGFAHGAERSVDLDMCFLRLKPPNIRCSRPASAGAPAGG